MSIDEMILQIDNECSYPEALSIIAALRAGQAMWDACNSDNMDIESSKRIVKAMNSWVKATKEDK